MLACLQVLYWARPGTLRGMGESPKFVKNLNFEDFGVSQKNQETKKTDGRTLGKVVKKHVPGQIVDNLFTKYGPKRRRRPKEAAAFWKAAGGRHHYLLR